MAPHLITRRTIILLWTFLGLYAIALAQGVVVGQAGAPTSLIGAVTTGSIQAVLAISLLAVSGALCITARQLIKAYSERITALETAIAAKESAGIALANEIRQLREQCHERFKT